MHSQPMHTLITALLASSLLAASSPVAAQAPAEERKAYGNPLGDVQQRIEFARQARTGADSRTGQAEMALKQVDLEVQAAQKQLDEVRARQAKAKRELGDARSASAGAKKDFEREMAELESMRRGQTKP